MFIFDDNGALEGEGIVIRIYRMIYICFIL